MVWEAARGSWRTSRSDAMPPSGIKPKETCLEPIPKSPEEDNKAGGLDKAQEILCVVLPADEDPTLRPASTTPSVVHSSFAVVAAMVGNTPFALGGGSVSAAAEQLHPHLDPQRTQGALRVTRKLPSAPDIRADEGRTPCRRNVGDVTLQRDYPRGHQAELVCSASWVENPNMVTPGLRLARA